MPNIPFFKDSGKNSIHSFQKVMVAKGISSTYDSKITNPTPVPPAPAPSIVTNGLLLNFDAASYAGIGDWIDQHAGVHATPFQNPAWSSDNGGIFTLTPSSHQYFSVPWPVFKPTYTIDIWFNYLAPGGNQVATSCLISDEFTGGPFNFVIQSTYNTVRTGWYPSNWEGQYADNNVGAPLPQDGSTWYNITMAVGVTEYKDYINGVVSYAPGDFGGGSAPTGSSSSQTMFIGKRWDGFGPNQDTVGAKIAVVNIYDRALTDAEVAQNFNFYKTRFGL
jgi:hypothetical protein